MNEILATRGFFVTNRASDDDDDDNDDDEFGAGRAQSGFYSIDHGPVRAKGKSVPHVQIIVRELRAPGCFLKFPFPVANERNNNLPLPILPGR